MSTQNNSLREAFNGMATSSEQDLLSVTAKRIKQEAEYLKGDIEDAYSQFFYKIEKQILEQVSGQSDKTPTLIAAYLGNERPWAALSPGWLDKKSAVAIGKTKRSGKASGSTEGFYTYSGITSFIGARQGPKLGASRKGEIGRAGAARAKTTSTGSFKTFIQKMEGTKGIVEKMFGVVTIKYEFAADGTKFYPVVIDNLLTRVTARNVARNRFEVLPKKFRIKATVEAFGKLSGVAFTERNVVDYILKRADPANEKQWVKINGSKGWKKSQRPMRAMIVPLINWYIQVGFQDALRNFQRELT